MNSVRLRSFLLVLLLVVSCRAGTAPLVIRSPLAGAWYDADPERLRADLAEYLASVPTPSPTGVCALIVPHAGYRYSGRVAAFGYRAVQGGTYRRVIVLGPSHRVYLPNAITVPNADAILTPLGAAELDHEFIGRLRASPYVTEVGEAGAGEHSVEIQIPFLQTVLPGVPLVPIIVGQLDDRAARGVADALRKEIDGETLVIASTDFTHYGSRFSYVPFTGHVEENLRQLDLGAEALIQKKDAAGFRAYCERTGATICGRDGVSVLLALLPAGATPHLLRYDTSGRLTGSFDSSVSYLSEAFTGRWPDGSSPVAAPVGADGRPLVENTLSDEDKQALIKLARATLDYYFEHGTMPATPQDAGVSRTPGMDRILGAFVTLKKDGDLRGCIGEIRPRRAVCDAVMEHAIDAAVHDPRFRPVTRDELAGLVIEISALQPSHPVASPRDIELGRHGIVLHKDGASAVFLPQVAPEQGWTLEETLSHLALKAGLAADAWKEGARFDVFEALVFGEGER